MSLLISLWQQKQKDKFRKQIRFIDPKNIKEDEWDEFEDFDDVK